MQTGCEAVVTWNSPVRFRRVCPLLQRNDAGFWVCSVAPAQVRPFWGRAFLHYGAGLLVVALLAALGVFGGMRAIGYHVSLRQVLWPPAWRELNAVRADLFVRQARESYAAGRVREAINALGVAYQLNPRHYEVGMMLAQFYQAANPAQADALYRRLLAGHPERRNETARVWFRSLLARGRLDDVAELARYQLTADPDQAAAWTHALLFATRLTHNRGLVVAARKDPATPASARAVLDLALRVREATRLEARRLLCNEPIASDFAYDRVYRVEALLRRSFPVDALDMLRQLRPGLTGRDVARLAFAAYAELGEPGRLQQEFSALLAPERQLHASEITLLAVHLVTYPDQHLLKLTIAALPRIPVKPADASMEAAIALFCAAGVQDDAAGMAKVKQVIAEMLSVKASGLDRLEAFFLDTQPHRPIETLLPGLAPLSLELNYALLERYPPAA